MTDEMCWKAALDYQNQRGYERGREEGREEGREQGLTQGREEERTKIAKALMNQGFSPETISAATGLSVEDIQQL